MTRRQTSALVLRYLAGVVESMAEDLAQLDDCFADADPDLVEQLAREVARGMRAKAGELEG